MAELVNILSSQDKNMGVFTYQMTLLSTRATKGESRQSLGKMPTPAVTSVSR
jgi:hypothetical protein